MQTFFMIAYPPLIVQLSIAIILAVSYKAIRWHLYDASAAFPTPKFYQPTDPNQLQLFAKGCKQ
jgi:hypothetical protein